jgi:hypothetical protein
MPLQKDWMNHLEQLPADARLTRTSMSEDDFKLEAIWKCAFPEGLKHNEVLQLIHLMYIVDGDDYPMSFRAVAHSIGILLGVYYIYPLNEVYGVYEIERNEAVQSSLKTRLETCGYYDWLADDGYPVIEAETIEELTPLLLQKRPCKRLTLYRQPFQAFVGEDDSTTINNILRSTLFLPDTWQGIKWRETTSIVLWDDTMRVLQYNSERTEHYMNQKEAHVLVGNITKALDDHERTARTFTNYRANGIWYSVTDSRWQYWIVTINSTDIGLFGIEED